MGLFSKPKVYDLSAMSDEQIGFLILFFRNGWAKETRRKLNRQRSVFPSDQALLKALYLSTFEATKKWTMPLRNWGRVYGELQIMYEGRLPE